MGREAREERKKNLLRFSLIEGGTGVSARIINKKTRTFFLLGAQRPTEIAKVKKLQVESETQTKREKMID